MTGAASGDTPNHRKNAGSAWCRPTPAVDIERHHLRPEPVPQLIKNASLASIMRASSFAAPGVTGPEATQSSSESSGGQAPAVKCRCLVMPECQALHGPCFHPPASGRQMASASSSLQFDILPDGDFRHDGRRFALRTAPAPGCCGAVARGLRTTCSRGSGPPVDQRGQVFTSNQAWTAGILS